jgi:hypothetical protein
MRFYEKVINVKADVAALLIFFSDFAVTSRVAWRAVKGAVFWREVWTRLAFDGIEVATTGLRARVVGNPFLAHNFRVARDPPAISACSYVHSLVPQRWAVWGTSSIFFSVAFSTASRL